MLKKLKEHIDDKLSFLNNKKLLIACSGGLDSVVLARTMNELGYEIGIAHCNFQLRGEESDADENFVVELSEMLEVAVYVEQFDTDEYASDHKLSIQMAARELRYKWFDEILTDFKYDYLLTAHQADDTLETMLINLSRGTGLKGLLGIPEVNDSVVRPLLGFSRQELLEYAKQQGYYWREDSSNAKTDYLRNAIRHKVIPPFKEEVNGLIKNVSNTREHLKDSAALIDDYLVLIRQLVVQETSDGLRIDIAKLNDLPNKHALLYELLNPFGFTAWKDISELLNAQSGKFIRSGTHRLLKDREVLLLTEIPSEVKKNTFEIKETTLRIDQPIPLLFADVESPGKNSDLEIFVDKDKLTYPLHVRKWREGDYFLPFGMKGKKKLSKYFKDEKLSLVAKEKTWLLCSGDEVVWVIGLRADERFKVEPHTRQIMNIRTSKSTS